MIAANVGTRVLDFEGHEAHLSGRVDDPYFSSVGVEPALGYAIGQIGQGDVVFDVGANVGVFTAFAAQRAGQLHSFEPDPSVFPHLERTVALNQLANVRLNAMALGAVEGEARIFSNPTSASASHLVTTDGMAQDGGSSISITTLDSYVAARGVDRLDLIKIDVEGFETDVLAGARKSIAGLRPSALVEFNAFTMIAFRDLNPRDLLRQLLDLFPNVAWFRGGTVLERMRTEADALTFIHDTIVAPGCVADLYCSFRD